MAEYQRFIAYLYEYGQDGGKTGAGHLRVELRQGKCRMTVRIRAKRAEGNCTLYFYIRKPGQMTGFPIGEVNINHGEAEFCFEGDASNLTGSGEDFDSVNGVLLLGETKGYLAADWDNQEVTPKEADALRVQPAADSKEEKVSEQSRNEENVIPENQGFEGEQQKQTDNAKENTVLTWEKGLEATVIVQEAGIPKEEPEAEGLVKKTGIPKEEPEAEGLVKKAGIPKEEPEAERPVQEAGILKQKPETGKEKAPEQVSDFWSAAKDIVKGLLNADQEIDPLDQITAVLRAERQKNQRNSENLPEEASDQTIQQKTSKEVPNQAMQQKISEEIPGQAIQQKTSKEVPNQTIQQKISEEIPNQVIEQKITEKASDKAVKQKTAEMNETVEVPTISEETKQVSGAAGEMVKTPETGAESLQALGKSEKNSSVWKMQAASWQTQGKRMRRDSRRASGSSGRPAVNPETACISGMTNGTDEAKSENSQNCVDEIQSVQTCKNMQKQDTGKEQEVTEKEQEVMEQASLPPDTSVYIAGMQEAAVSAEPGYSGGLHQTAMESLNAAAKPYCGNRRLPWQDAPEAREILDTCVKMYPFQDGELAECVRIEPRDIGRLPMEYWHLGNNSFLLHGYCNYKYLLFAKRMNRIRCEYLLMIPGIFQQKEKMMARMFGFEQFKCARRREQRPGEFGYWYMTLIF